MFLHALHIIRHSLEDYLNGLGTATDDQVLIGNVAVQDDDAYSPVIQDRIVMTLVRIQEEQTLKNRPAGTRNMATGRMEYHNPPLALNVYLLFTINSNNYSNALTYLSRVMRFFQKTNRFDPSNSPVIPESDVSAVDRMTDFRIVADLYSPTFEEQNHLWSILGSKQLPSVLYRLRIVELEDRQLTASGPLIEEINIES
jgi:hypothetical protein